MVAALLPKHGALVDFGAGPGAFLSAVADERPDVRLFAIEPYMPASPDPRITYLSSFRELDEPVDVITALEVCEHLGDRDLANFLAESRLALGGKGRLLVSVPIMVGPAVVVKELNRVVQSRRPSQYSLAELAMAAVGVRVRRPNERGPTHKGFDFRELRSLIRESFHIEREILSPLPLPWWANSQAFFVCR